MDGTIRFQVFTFTGDWTFMNLVEDKSEKLVESRRVEYFDADGGHVS